jgi:MoxR-like ATPase
MADTTNNGSIAPITPISPRQLFDELDKIVANKVMDSVLILGESGVGKSNIVNDIGLKYGFEGDQAGEGAHVVMWGQLTPVDARGVPVPVHDSKQTVFYTPDFWPKKGPGIIFLDEFNMASTTMMAIGQQLLLNRRFGNYRVPDDVFVWAAGNRKIDKAAVNEIPFPVNNRVAHYEIMHDLESWEFWAYAHEQSPDIIGFLKFRTELLHRPSNDSAARAWPSPRSWEMANRRLKANMQIGPVVGESVAAEFDAFCTLKDKLPDLKQIADGNGDKINFPLDDEPSLKYAVMSELTYWGLKDVEIFKRVFYWFHKKCKNEPEWISMFVLDSMRIMNRNDPKKGVVYMSSLMKIPEAKEFIQKYVELTTGRTARS